MATITGASINIVSDSKAKTAKVTVKCNVKFTPVELCQMKSCGGRWFKLKCQLWGADSGLNFGDDPLFTFPSVLFFPDPTPTADESRSFEAIVGEGVLDEDLGTDEVYAKLTLTNLNTHVSISKKTKEWVQSF